MKRLALIACVLIASLPVLAALFGRALAQDAASPPSEPATGASAVFSAGPCEPWPLFPGTIQEEIARPSIGYGKELARNWVAVRLGDLGGTFTTADVLCREVQAAAACVPWSDPLDGNGPHRAADFQCFAQLSSGAMSKADHLTLAADHLEAAGLHDEAWKVRQQLAVEANRTLLAKKLAELAVLQSEIEQLRGHVAEPTQFIRQPTAIEKIFFESLELNGEESSREDAGRRPVLLDRVFEFRYEA